MRSAKLRCEREVAMRSAKSLREVAKSMRSVAKSLREVAKSLRIDFATSRSDFALRIATSRYASQLRATHRNFAKRNFATSQLRVTYDQRCNGGPSRPSYKPMLARPPLVYTKIMKSTVSPSRYFDMRHRGLAAARLTLRNLSLDGKMCLRDDNILRL